MSHLVCRYHARCPCYIDERSTDEGHCIHIYINCRLAKVFHLEDKFSWPEPKQDKEEG